MVRHPGIILLALVCVVLQAGLSHAQGVLQDMRESVQQDRNPEPKEADAEKRSRASEYDEYDDRSMWDDFIGKVLLMGVTSPFWGPPVWLGDSYDSTSYLSCHPYQHESSAFVLTEPLPDSEYIFNWSLRVRGEYADDFDALTRYGGRLLWESRKRLGFDASLDYRRESLNKGRHDDLWTGDANAVIRFAQSDYLMMRSGLGVNYISADHGTNVGFNFTYGGDWLPVEPWIVSAEFDWGWIGKTSLIHARTTIGIVIQSVEIYAGYNYFDVGTAHMSGVVSGIQVWY